MQLYVETNTSHLKHVLFNAFHTRVQMVPNQPKPLPASKGRVLHTQVKHTPNHVM